MKDASPGHRDVRKAIDGGIQGDVSHEQKAPIDLLAFAGHVIVPVHERTVWVVPPRPNVQLEKRRYTVAVRTANEQEGLSFEYRRIVVVIC